VLEGLWEASETLRSIGRIVLGFPLRAGARRCTVFGRAAPRAGSPPCFIGSSLPAALCVRRLQRLSPSEAVLAVRAQPNSECVASPGCAPRCSAARRIRVCDTVTSLLVPYPFNIHITPFRNNTGSHARQAMHSVSCSPHCSRDTLHSLGIRHRR
jgi:hypothetical protein